MSVKAVVPETNSCLHLVTVVTQSATVVAIAPQLYGGDPRICSLMGSPKGVP